MTETLTEDEIREFRAMKDEWAQMQAALKMGTSDRPTRDGHAHRDNVIREQGSGAPTHVAKQGTLYWDTTSKVQYVNSSGSTTWAEQSSGGAAGFHTIIGATHTDTSGTPSLLDLFTFTAIGGGQWVPLAPDLHGAHFTNALAIAAVPYRSYQQF